MIFYSKLIMWLCFSAISLGCDNSIKKVFPGNFKTAKLFSMDSIQYFIHNFNSIQKEYNGDRVIDNRGISSSNHYDEFDFTALQLKKIKEFFTEASCKDGMFISKTCMPIYRDAIGFYNYDQKLIAVVQICFDCEMVELPAIQGYDMCNFENKLDWNVFRSFINTIKQNKIFISILH